MSGGTLYTSAKRPGGQILGGTLCTTTPVQEISIRKPSVTDNIRLEVTGNE